MRYTLPRDAAHTLASGGAGALRPGFSEHVLRTAFASGLNAALLVAGVAGVIAGTLVLVLVRQPENAVTRTAPQPLKESVPRG
jgi:molybdopterin biosynthesis enzyme MoaB